MIVNNVMEVLKGLSESRVGELPGGKFLRFFSASELESGMEDVVLSTLEIARRTQYPCNDRVEFMLYERSSGDNLLVLCGSSAEDVAYFNLRAIGEQINKIITELVSEWQTFDLSHGDVLYQVQDKVVEVSLSDIQPINDSVSIKSFTFGSGVDVENTASNISKYIIDLLFHTGSSKELLPVRANDAGSIVIVRPEVVDFLRSLFIGKPTKSPKKSIWQKITGA